MRRKITLFFGLTLFVIYGWAQTTATDFNVTDCGGQTRHLFAELDAGKVVVMSMVHPCGSCVAPTKTTIGVVNSFSSTNPGRVIFYLSDDVGDISCSSLTGWANTYGITGVPVISNAAVKQSDYGSSGMPKILVLGGAHHGIYLNQNNGINTTDLTTAINNALAATAVAERNKPIDFKLYPSPVQNQVSLGYNLTTPSSVSIEIIDLLGSQVKYVPVEQQKAGPQNISIATDQLSNGVYFIRLSINDQISTLKFTVSR